MKKANFFDRWLYQRGIIHPVITPVLRNLLLLMFLAFVGGVFLGYWFAWTFWLAVGTAMTTWIFWGLAHFFLRQPLGEYSSAFLRIVLFRFSVRMIFIAIVAYVALIEYAASPIALVGGVTLGLFVALFTFLIASRQETRP